MNKTSKSRNPQYATSSTTEATKTQSTSQNQAIHMHGAILFFKNDKFNTWKKGKIKKEKN